MVSKKTFNVEYADQRSAVAMHADLDMGWRKLKKTFGFFAQRTIPFKGDWTIRAQLSLIVQPATSSNIAAEFPSRIAGWDNDWIDVLIAEKILRVKIPLIPDHLRVLSTGNPGIYIELLELFTEGQFHYDLRALIAFHSPYKPPPKDVREWGTGFLPGGLPGTSRRH